MSEFGKDINVHSRKGVFIPYITVEMFRNAPLEGVEELMANGEMEDISLPSAQLSSSCAHENDTVSRRAAIDGVKTLHDVAWKNWHEPTLSANVVLDMIRELPSAQPEIIYCKKCKHWTRTCGDEQWSLGDCDVFDKHLVMCNGYCAWAERREDGNG